MWFLWLVKVLALQVGAFTIGGVVIGPFFVLSPIIVINFGIPLARKWKREGILTSNAPIRNYVISLVLQLGTLALVTWPIAKYFLECLPAYGLGIVCALLLGARKIGANPDNLADFIRTNRAHISADVLPALEGLSGDEPR